MTPIPWRERAARKLCELRGLDPDEQVFDGPIGDGPVPVCARWVVAYRVIDAELARQQVAEAIAFAREVGGG